MPENNLQSLKKNERDSRRKLILGAALTLFAIKDFRSVTVREIAKQAGVSIGTIYNYYPNLTELFLGVFIKCIQEITHILNDMNKDNVPTLEELCTSYISYLNENMTFYQMMSHFMLGGDMSAQATQKLDENMTQLMNHLENAVQRAGTKDDSRLTAHALFSALNGIMISYARYPGRTDDEIRRHTLRLAGIIAGIFDRNGHPVTHTNING